MKEVSYENFLSFIKENGLNGKGQSVAIADPALIVYQIDKVIVAKIQLPNIYCDVRKYFLLN